VGTEGGVGGGGCGVARGRGMYRSEGMGRAWTRGGIRACRANVRPPPREQVCIRVGGGANGEESSRAGLGRKRGG